jgi:predicted dehydrogenase
MVNVGVIGLGMMGLTHLDCYAKRPDAKVVAVADADADRRSGRNRASGNIDGQAQGGFDFASVRQYADGMELIDDPEVQLVDICLPTPLHARFAIAAMRKGKHLLVEKPLARTAADADAIVAEAARSGVIAMPAMCMRFWPGWTWLKTAIAENTCGLVRSAHFRRLASHPGAPFYLDGRACGGAALDLHIHDADFVRWCFGPPRSVSSHGYTGVSGCIDHIVTHYHYDDVPLVVAEGGWTMQPGFPFTMQYTVNFEHATAVYDLAAADKLMLYRKGEAPTAIPVDPSMGYDHEIAYILDCIQAARPPIIVTLAEAAEAVRLVEAELRSMQPRSTPPA